MICGEPFWRDSHLKLATPSNLLRRLHGNWGFGFSNAKVMRIKRITALRQTDAQTCSFNSWSSHGKKNRAPAIIEIGGTGYKMSRWDAYVRQIYNMALNRNSSVVAPARSRTQHMDDPADHTAVIHPRLAAHVLGQMRLDLPPLFIAQPKQMPAHVFFPTTRIILLLSKQPR